MAVLIIFLISDDNIPKIGKEMLSRHNMRERGGKNTDKENLGELWDIYFNNRSLLSS